MKKIALHIQILIGMGLGLIFALLSIQLGWPATLTVNYIKPLGTIFLNSLKMITIPLILVSLILGITNIKDVAKLSRIGGKTIFIYTTTTVVAVILGLAGAGATFAGLWTIAEAGRRNAERVLVFEMAARSQGLTTTR